MKMKKYLSYVFAGGAGILGSCSSSSSPAQPDSAPPPCDQTIKGNICTIAGSGMNGYAGDDGPALEAKLSLPQDTVHSSDGTLYILDWNNHRIRSVGSDGVMRAVAGNGEIGGTLDSPANGDFNHPTGMLFSPDETKLVIAAWHNSKVRVMDVATKAITDVGGDGRRAYFGDETSALTASFDLPASIAWTPTGDLIVMDQANQVLRRIDSAGVVHHVAGRCVVDAPAPLGGGPCADGVDPTVCAPPSGKTTCGNAGTCTAPCTPSYDGEDGPATEMRIAQPFGQSADPAGRIIYDTAGNLFFADTGNNLIREITTDGMVHRFAGVAPIDKVPQSGASGDGGMATSALLNNPVDLAFGDDGTLYFSDVYNHCVRAIASTGIISTVAGQCGVDGYTGDGGPATAATLKRAYGIEVFKGVLYISDTGNNVIRAVKL
jgi:DNA-binding beta-propeller fold protein YncE